MLNYLTLQSGTWLPLLWIRGDAASAQKRIIIHCSKSCSTIIKILPQSIGTAQNMENNDVRLHILTICNSETKQMYKKI